MRDASPPGGTRPGEALAHGAAPSCDRLDAMGVPPSDGGRCLSVGSIATGRVRAAAPTFADDVVRVRR